MKKYKSMGKIDAGFELRQAYLEISQAETERKAFFDKMTIFM